ncbi:hypothetical protein DL89DRAFT_265485 [Linderina pennispora]|uniref:DUF2423 domain-containing protein n=1 Tax=Linderina pennispora TaxID=61395 RepID=A0A1Y1WE11_9FUNG|nr:uncharacterized protein DL89DRAFT_265485 [Linderina pennispora]ORX71769.1 hypothetical protein DL89DRAFT_265485 [Linderina pennispora]
MGKSIRSKSKIRNRNILRETVFGPAEAERIKRLAEKQKKQKQQETQQAGTEADDSMAVDGSEAAQTESSMRKKRGKSQKRGIKKITVRNKKGRIMSKNVVKWTKQSRFKK